jgi:VWFA-related protein
MTERCSGSLSRLLATICCGLLPANAQAPEVRIATGAWFPPSLTISADTNLVELAATVRDRQDRLVGGLHASDFELLDNNHPREITFFSEQRSQPPGPGVPKPTVAKLPTAATAPVQAPEPRTIALFLDDAHASLLGVHKSAEAAAKLISNTLHSGDKVGIFTASGSVSVDFTGDRDVLLAALARLAPHKLNGVHTQGALMMSPFTAYVIIHHLDPTTLQTTLAMEQAFTCPTREPGCMMAQGGSLQETAQTVWEQSEYQFTTTLDAMGIVIRHLARAPGKRILLLMSPGFPTGGMESRTSGLMDAALRANIRIGAVNSEGLPPNPSPLERMVDGEFMRTATKATGGEYRDYTNDLSGALQAVTADPEISYVLGFSPPGEADGQYHLLRTRIAGSRGYRVESRAGYFAAAVKRETAQHHIDRVAMSNDEMKEFPTTLAVSQNEATIHVTISVDTKGLKFPEKEGRRVEELTFLTVLEDAAGNFVAGQQSVMDMALTSTTLAEKLQKGIQAATSLPVPRPGTYRVREVVREAVQDHIWANTSAIEIR